MCVCLPQRDDVQRLLCERHCPWVPDAPVSTGPRRMSVAEDELRQQQEDLRALQGTTAMHMWLRDLQELLSALEEDIRRPVWRKTAV